MPAVFQPRTYQISNVRKSKALILKALDVYYAMALSKHDVKPSGILFSKKLHATLDSQVTSSQVKKLKSE